MLYNLMYNGTVTDMTTKTPVPPSTPDQIVELAKRLNDEAGRRFSSLKTESAIVHVDDATSRPNPPAPAWYEPSTGDIHIHLTAANVNAKAALVDYSHLVDASVVRGLLVHEMSHSKRSGWLTKLWGDKSIKPIVMKVLTMFEEMRVEAHAVNANPYQHRKYLRAALPLAMGNLKDNPPTTRYDAAASWGLIFGRVMTTVITAKELEWVDNLARAIIGHDDVDQLVDILQEAIDVSERRADRLVELAEEWLEVTGMPEKPPAGSGGCAHEKGEDKDGEKSDGKGKADKSDEAGDDGESGGGSGAEEGEDDADADGDEPGEGMSELGKRNSQESTDGKAKVNDSISEDDAKALADAVDRAVSEVGENWSNAKVDMADVMEMAKKVFGGRRDELSRGVERSEPTARHHVHVAQTTKALEEMVIPAVTKVSVASELPPGRLRTREAVRASAERAQGRMVTARPWEAQKRRHSSTRPIVVGIATDISGSMKWAESMVADFAYVWANAGRRVGARTAAVTFGDYAEAIVGPGEVLSEIRKRGANGGSEECDKALAALDGVLKLTAMNGAAKLLVIVSDGCLVIAQEMDRVRHRLAEFKKGGTTVIWVTPTADEVRPLQKLGLCEVVSVDLRKLAGDTFGMVNGMVLDKLKRLTQIN